MGTAQDPAKLAREAVRAAVRACANEARWRAELRKALRALSRALKARVAAVYASDDVLSPGGLLPQLQVLARQRTAQAAALKQAAQVLRRAVLALKQEDRPGH